MTEMRKHGDQYYLLIYYLLIIVLKISCVLPFLSSFFRASRVEIAEKYRDGPNGIPQFFSMLRYMFCQLNLLAQYSMFFNVAMNVVLACQLNILARHLMEFFFNAELNIVLAQHSPFFQCPAEYSVSLTFQIDIRRFSMFR